MLLAKCSMVRGPIITDVVDAKDCMKGMNAAMSPDAIKVLYKF